MPRTRRRQRSESPTWNPDVNPAVEGDEFLIVGLLNLLVKFTRMVRTRVARAAARSVR